MAEHHRKPRKGNRHANKLRTWHPKEDLYDEAMEVLKGEMNWTMSGFLTECLRWFLGLRKTPPPRPQWAEERAAALPDDVPIRPDDAIDT